MSALLGWGGVGGVSSLLTASARLANEASAGAPKRQSVLYVAPICTVPCTQKLSLTWLESVYGIVNCAMTRKYFWNFQLCDDGHHFEEYVCLACGIACSFHHGPKPCSIHGCSTHTGLTLYTSVIHNYVLQMNCLTTQQHIHKDVQSNTPTWLFWRQMLSRPQTSDCGNTIGHRRLVFSRTGLKHASIVSTMACLQDGHISYICL